jgi:hypothetical protein
MKIGYPCLNRTIGCKADRTFRLWSYSQARLIETVANNLDCLERILRWNVEQHIPFFRITSDLDVMLEIKDKEASARRAVARAGADARFLGGGAPPMAAGKCIFFLNRGKCGTNVDNNTGRALGGLGNSNASKGVYDGSGYTHG